MRLLLANGLFWGNVIVACLSTGILLVGISFGTRWRQHILALMPGHHLSLVSAVRGGAAVEKSLEGAALETGPKSENRSSLAMFHRNQKPFPTG